MSDDLIRRSDAIKAFCIDCKGQGEPCEHSDTCKTMKILRSRKKIPAVEPKRGEWKIEETESVWGKGYLLTCSVCGDTFRVTENALPYEKYCRNCGADMRGKGDE